MQPHEFANLFPMMSESEIKTLALDIQERGQQNPVWLLDGKILDGRNRYAACKVIKMTPRLEIYSGSDPLGFVISSNLHRRHLTESQRGMIAAKLVTMTQGHRSDLGSSDPKLGLEKASQMMHIGSATVKRAKFVQNNAIPEIIAAVESGEINVTQARRAAELPKDEQRAAMANGAATLKAVAPPPPSKSGATSSPRMPRYIPSDSREIWQQAKMTLERILPNDKHREEVLEEIISYCKDRIKNKK